MRYEPLAAALILWHFMPASILMGQCEHPRYAWSVPGVGRIANAGNAGDLLEGGTSYSEFPYEGNALLLARRISDGHLLWSYQVGGPEPDHANGVAVDRTGDIFVVGSFGGTVDFDPGPGMDLHSATSRYNTFLVKLTHDGSFVWAKSFDGPGEATGRNVAIDPIGNIILTGGLFQSVDFDPSDGVDIHTEPGLSFDVYVTKLTAEGEYLWTKTFGGRGFDSPTKIATDASGNIYVSGEFRGQADFDPGPGTAYRTAQSFPSDVFINKLHADGTYAWTVTYPLATRKEFAVTLDGGVVLPGQFTGTVDFDRGPGQDTRSSAAPGTGLYDLFVTKLNADGSYGWTYTIGNPAADKADLVAVLPDGNILVMGQFQGTADFDPGPGIAEYTASGDPSGASVFLLQLDNEGNFLTVHLLESSFNADFPKLAVDDEGNVFFSRHVYARGDLDPTCEVDVRPPAFPLDAPYYMTKLTCEQRTGDFDGDGRVDLRDLAAFQNCFEGEDATTCNPGCDEFDLAPDNAIDLFDFERLIELRSGP